MFKPQKIPTVAGSLLLASVLAACGGGSSPPPIAEPEPAPDPAPPYVTSAAPCFSTGYLDGSHVDHSNFYREIAVSGARTGILKHRVSSVQESIFPGLPPNGQFGDLPAIERKVSFSEIFTAPGNWAGMRGGERKSYYSLIEERRIREFGFVEENRWLNGASSAATFAYHSPVESLRYTLVNPGDQAEWRVPPATATGVNWDGSAFNESLPVSTVKMTYVGREVIQVPAGSFETCRYSREQDGQVAQEWIGMGEYAGMSIKREVYTNAGLELHELSEFRVVPTHHEWPLPDPHWLPAAPQVVFPDPHGQLTVFIE